jgi:hypothetical protein
MDISFSSVAAGIIFGGVGFWLFREGKRRGNMPVLLISMIMMVYSYFTPAPWMDWGGGVLLCLAARYFWY